MERRRLGNTNTAVSVLALGTWAMGGDDESWGHVNDNESIAAINAAIDGGINLLDTAPAYGNGHAETILGKAIRARRHEVVLATKCGFGRSKAGGAARTRWLTKAEILAECEASLRRLGVGCIDLYQCHGADPDAPVQETLEALETLRTHGKIRAIGLSNFGYEEALRVAEFGPFSSLQVPFSLIRRRAERHLIPFCQDREIALLACSPLAKGLLTGRLGSDSKIVGRRAEDPEFRGNRLRRNLRLVEKLVPIARSYDKTVAQFALRWVTQQEGVTCAIIGAKRPSQVVENLGALDFEITSVDLRAVDALTEDA